MTDRATTAILIHERQAYWRIELPPLPSCRQALGPDVLNAFCHCFVQAERLTALCQLSFLSRMNRGRLSSARQTHTLLWFTAGTLRELLVAVDNLRTTLDRRGLIERDGVIDRDLCAVVTQWELDPVFKVLRGVATFHIDSIVMDRGLDALEAGRIAVVASEGQGPEGQQPSLLLGIAAACHGLPVSPEDADRFMQQVDGDQSATTIHHAFVAALEASGIPMETADAFAAC